MHQAPFPNTFIIGVQKAGTTTLNDWLSQHPQVYGYNTLKDVHLFARFKNRTEIQDRLNEEPIAYNNEPIVLQSAVNYIFYPSLLQQIAQQVPGAKLILILRNPVQRAVSAYSYFVKMLREGRSVHEALLYQPKKDFPFSKDNNDFTYIEHGLYGEQVKNALKFFTREQLLVLDYEELKQPSSLLTKVFSFLQIKTDVKPDTTSKNITGTIKNAALQKGIIGQSPFKKLVIKYLINPWLPVTKRKKWKAKLFEMNTSKTGNSDNMSMADNADIKKYLKTCFEEDTKQLDALLQTSFHQQWFANTSNKEPLSSSSSHV